MEVLIQQAPSKNMRDLIERQGSRQREQDVGAVDIEVLQKEFEKRWRINRRARSVVEHQDGSRTVFETYQIPCSNKVLKDTDIIEDLPSIEEFGTTASILGYRSTIGPLLIPVTRKPLEEGSPYPMALFFLERTELSE